MSCLQPASLKYTMATFLLATRLVAAGATLSPYNPPLPSRYPKQGKEEQENNHTKHHSQLCRVTEGFYSLQVPDCRLTQSN